MAETRKLAAILAADVVGYSRLAGADEDRTLARLRALRSDLIDPTIAVHHGRVVKRTGDGILIEFRSVVDAVRCAIEVQNAMIERNAGVPQELLKAETADREVRSMAYQLKAARFPNYRDLAGFDFASSEVNEALVRRLHRCDFIEPIDNIVLVGGPGTGKTHIA